MYGGAWERTAALALFVVLGLTDYLDGIMARRDGSTPLGRLLDPIADKIFLAVTFVPLLHLGILPVWIVWPIFLREFLVTELRRFMTGRETGLKVTELAKLKTTLQMTGFGLILFNATFPDKGVSIALLLMAIVASGVAWLILRLRRRDVHPRIKKALLWAGIGLVIILPCSAGCTNIIYGIVLVAITLLSGWQYIRTGFPICVGKGARSLLSLAASLLLPLSALALVKPEQPASVLVIVILSLEFAVQGLDMWARQEGFADISGHKRRFIIPVAFLPLLYGMLTGSDTTSLFILAAFVSSLAYAIYDFVLHRKLVFDGMF
jgi:CDP-diacylglycerol--glycerol-3-phosphate 3-phosphatidyltransferase